MDDALFGIFSVSRKQFDTLFFFAYFLLREYLSISLL